MKYSLIVLIFFIASCGIEERKGFVFNPSSPTYEKIERPFLSQPPEIYMRIVDKNVDPYIVVITQKEFKALNSWLNEAFNYSRKIEDTLEYYEMIINR